MGRCYNFNNNALVDVGGEKLSFYTRWNLATDRTTFSGKVVLRQAILFAEEMNTSPLTFYSIFTA